LSPQLKRADSWLFFFLRFFLFENKAEVICSYLVLVTCLFISATYLPSLSSLFFSSMKHSFRYFLLPYFFLPLYSTPAHPTPFRQFSTWCIFLSFFFFFFFLFMYDRIFPLCCWLLILIDYWESCRNQRTDGGDSTNPLN